MSQVLTANEIRETKPLRRGRHICPRFWQLRGAFVMLGLRLQIGAKFISDTALMMLALACYILAALFQLTNLYAPSEMAQKIGLWSATLGVFFNLSSWLVRWVTAYDIEIVQTAERAEIWKRRGCFAIFRSPIFMI